MGISQALGETRDWFELLRKETEHVFQLYPRQICTFHERLRDLLLDRYKNKSWEKCPQKKAKEKALRRLEGCVNEERRQNETRNKHLFGKNISFGDTVQFLHVNSQSFITGKKKGFFVLEKWLSSEMHFQLKPRFNLRFYGNPIYMDSNVLLFSSFYQMYMELEHEKFRDVEHNKPSIAIMADAPLDTSFQSRKKIGGNAKGKKNSLASKKFSKKKDVTLRLSLESTNNWRLNILGSSKSFNKDVSVIKGGDFVYLKHEETNSYMTVELEKSEFANTYLRQYSGSHPLEARSLLSVWQVLHKGLKVKKYKTDSIIILKSPFLNQILSYESGTLQCSLNLGEDMVQIESLEQKFFEPKRKTLVSQESLSLNVNKSRMSHATEDYIQNSTQINIISQANSKSKTDNEKNLKEKQEKKKNPETIRFGDGVALRLAETGLFFHCSINISRAFIREKLQETHFEVVKSSEHNPFKLEKNQNSFEKSGVKKLYIDLLLKKTLQASLKDEHFHWRDAFKIEKVPREHTICIYAFKPIFPLLKEIIRCFNTGQAPSIELLRKASHGMDYLIKLLKGEENREYWLPKSLDVSSIPKFVLVERKKSFKDIGVIDVIMEVIQSEKSVNFFQNDSLENFNDENDYQELEGFVSKSYLISSKFRENTFSRNDGLSMREVSNMNHTLFFDQSKLDSFIEKAYEFLMMLIGGNEGTLEGSEESYHPNLEYMSQWVSYLIDMVLAQNNDDEHKRTSYHMLLGKIVERSQEMMKNIGLKSVYQIARLSASLSDVNIRAKFNLLEKLLRFDGLIILEHQNAIFKGLFEQEETSIAASMKVSLNSEGVPGVVVYGVWMSIDTFEYNFADQNEKLFDIFCDYLLLLGNLCDGNHELIIEKVKSYYSLEFCLAVLEIPEPMFKLKRAIFSIIMNCHVEGEIVPRKSPSLMRFHSGMNENQMKFRKINALDFSQSISMGSSEKESKSHYEQDALLIELPEGYLERFTKFLKEDLDLQAKMDLNDYKHQSEKGFERDMYLKSLVNLTSLLVKGNFLDPKTFFEDALSLLCSYLQVPKRMRFGRFQGDAFVARESRNAYQGVELAILQSMLELSNRSVDMWIDQILEETTNESQKAKKKDEKSCQAFIKETLKISSFENRERIMKVLEKMISSRNDCVSEKALNIYLKMHSKAKRLKHALKHLYIFTKENLFSEFRRALMFRGALKEMAISQMAWINTEESSQWLEIIEEVTEMLKKEVDNPVFRRIMSRKTLKEKINNCPKIFSTKKFLFSNKISFFDFNEDTSIVKENVIRPQTIIYEFFQDSFKIEGKNSGHQENFSSRKVERKEAKSQYFTRFDEPEKLKGLEDNSEAPVISLKIQQTKGKEIREVFRTVSNQNNLFFSKEQTILENYNSNTSNENSAYVRAPANKSLRESILGQAMIKREEYDRYNILYLANEMAFQKSLVHIMVENNFHEGIIDFLMQASSKPVKTFYAEETLLQTVNFLTAIVKESPKVKAQLIPKLEQIIDLMKQPCNVNAHFLFREIIKNSEVLLNITKIRSFSQEIIKILEKVIQNDVMAAASILSVAETIFQHENHLMKSNQFYFLGKFMEKPLVFWSWSEPFHRELLKEVIEYQVETYAKWRMDSLADEFYISFHLAYLNEMLSTLVTASLGDNKSSISIVKSTVKLQDLLEILSISKSFIYLKKNILRLIYYCYLEDLSNDSYMQRDFTQKNLRFIMDSALEELFAVDNELRKEDWRIMSNIKKIQDHRGLLTLYEAQLDLLTNGVLPILLHSSFHEVFDFSSNVKSEGKVVAKDVVDILGRVRMHVHKGSYSLYLIEKCLNRLYSFYLLPTFTTDNKEEIDSPLSAGQKKRKITIKQTFQLKTARKKELDNPKSINESLPKRIEKKIKKFLPILEKIKEEEKENGLKCLKKLGEKSGKYFFRLLSSASLSKKKRLRILQTTCELLERSTASEKKEYIGKKLAETLFELLIRSKCSKEEEQLIVSALGHLFKDWVLKKKQGVFDDLPERIRMEFQEKLREIMKNTFEEVSIDMKARTAEIFSHFYENISLIQSQERIKREGVITMNIEETKSVHRGSNKFRPSMIIFRKKSKHNTQGNAEDRNNKLRTLAEVLNESSWLIEKNNTMLRRISKKSMQNILHGINVLDLYIFNIFNLRLEKSSESIEEIIQFFLPLEHTLSLFVKHWNGDCIEIGRKLIHVLRQCISEDPLSISCYRKKLSLSKSRIIESISQFISEFPLVSHDNIEEKKVNFFCNKRGVRTQELYKVFCMMRYECFCFLNEFVACNISQRLIKGIEKSISYEYFHCQMVRTFRRFVEKRKGARKYRKEDLKITSRNASIILSDADSYIRKNWKYLVYGPLKEALVISNIFSNITEHSEEAKQKLDSVTAKASTVYDFCAREFFKKWTGRVEIVGMNNILTSHYFTINPNFTVIEPQIKRELEKLLAVQNHQTQLQVTPSF